MNKSLLLSKLLAFIYYSEGGFEDFFVGYTADPLAVNCDENIKLTKKNFKITEADTSDVAIEAVKYLIDLGCDGDSGHAVTNKSYVYVYLRIVQTTT